MTDSRGEQEPQSSNRCTFAMLIDNALYVYDALYAYVQGKR